MPCSPAAREEGGLPAPWSPPHPCSFLPLILHATNIRPQGRARLAAGRHPPARPGPFPNEEPLPSLRSRTHLHSRRVMWCLKLWPQGLPVYLPLSVLFLQTTMPLLIRHTRKPSADGSPQYHPASVTLLAELVKCLTAFAFICRITRRQRPTASVRDTVKEAGQRFTRAIWRMSALLLPAMLYFASNVTAMHALSHLRSYIFTAIMNSRIVFAALLSMLLLHKSINADQWRAILIIFCAATVLCLEDVQTSQGFTWTEESLGIFMALGGALVSAAGGVLVEKYLNHPATVLQSVAPPSGGDADDEKPFLGGADTAEAHSASTLWEQQGVLALFSAAFADLYVLLFLREVVQARRLLEGWTSMTVVVMLMQALQGIMVAMTIQRCGIVFRLILGTISICLCIIVESVLYLEPVLIRECLSILLVIVGSNMYSSASPLSSPSSSSVVAPVPPHKDVAGRVADEAHAAVHGAGSSGITTRNTRRRCSPTPP